MRYDIPYGDKKVFFEAPEGSVIFEGKMTITEHTRTLIETNFTIDKMVKEHINLI